MHSEYYFLAGKCTYMQRLGFLWLGAIRKFDRKCCAAYRICWTGASEVYGTRLHWHLDQPHLASCVLINLLEVEDALSLDLRAQSQLRRVCSDAT